MLSRFVHIALCVGMVWTATWHGMIPPKPLGFTPEFRFDYEASERAGGWLKYHGVPATWDSARLRCHAEGAVLASPLTIQLKAAILEFVKKQLITKYEDFPNIFTGVHDTFSKGDYSSIEGVPLLRLAISWAEGEPDNYNNLESCLAMRVSSGLMGDTHCNNVLPYVCYKRNTPLTMNICGTTDSEYHLEPETGNCYKFHRTGLIWSQAYMTCVAEGGYLAVINNNQEAKVIQNIISRHPENSIVSRIRNTLAIGFHDWGHLGSSYMTIHGDSLEQTYSNWAGSEPNNSTNERIGDKGQYCGGVIRNAQLDDIWCHEPLAFLCEKDPKSLL